VSPRNLPLLQKVEATAGNQKKTPEAGEVETARSR
jgi:hypothetical protein